MFQIGLNEYKVIEDAKKCILNMTEWFQQISNAGKNNYGIVFKKAVAIEQEFNSPVFGLRGKVDATLKLVHPITQESRMTALELKTGRE